MLPHTVTLYNVEKNTDPETMEDTLTNHITILRGVFFSPVRAAGNASKDGATLHIPFSVAAESAEDGAPVQYADPAAYHAAADRSGLWTLEPFPSCFFVRDVAVRPEKTYQQINAEFTHVYAVTAVETCDFGAEDLRHWEVTGA